MLKKKNRNKDLQKYGRRDKEKNLNLTGIREKQILKQLKNMKKR